MIWADSYEHAMVAYIAQLVRSQQKLISVTTRVKDFYYPDNVVTDYFDIAFTHDEVVLVNDKPCDKPELYVRCFMQAITHGEAVKLAG